MDSLHLFSALLFLFTICSVRSVSANSSCPVDLSYVSTIPWDAAMCRNSSGGHCCQTLLSLFGMGIAQHLRETGLFQFPNATTSSSCLSDFQAKLAAMSLDPGLVPFCFKNSTQFVANDSNCIGIINTQDWVQKVGPMTPLDTSCKGDVSGLTQCSACLDAGLKVTAQLTSLGPNETSKCFYYTCLYAVAIVNELGPLNAKAAGCILALPLTDSSTDRPSKRTSNNTTLRLVSAFLGAFVGVFLVSALVIVGRKWNKKRKNNAKHRQIVNSFKANVLPSSGSKWFHLAELEKATNGFSQKNFIGQGSYGVVYKGTLADGTTVAVKQMHDLDSQGDEEFSNEVELISKIRHRNLLSLRGCCVASDDWKGNRRYLVYDFMPNGSLSDHLANETTRKKLLTWPHRKNIILDVARGLEYLHHGIKPAIYHRDIKATNILLDQQMRAKVGDFGLAKQSSEGHSHLTTRVAGTHGYLAPEYALYGQLTEKSDVYSFGILILEIMSGRKVLDTTNSSFLLITDWAWTLAKSGKIEETFDEDIREQGPKGLMERFVNVGMLCAHIMVALRPTISDALKMLEGDIEIPRLPDRPLPLSHESFRSSMWLATSSSRINSSTVNILS